MKCARCGDEAKYKANGELLCRDCLVEEYGLCAVCANSDTCDEKPEDMVLMLCSAFDEIQERDYGSEKRRSGECEEGVLSKGGAHTPRPTGELANSGDGPERRVSIWSGEEPNNNN